jgi:hypothetical protein
MAAAPLTTCSSPALTVDSAAPCRGLPGAVLSTLGRQRIDTELGVVRLDPPVVLVLGPVVHKAGLKREERPAFGQDYARALDEAWKRFRRNPEDIKRLGYEDVFIRGNTGTHA